MDDGESRFSAGPSVRALAHRAFATLLACVLVASSSGTAAQGASVAVRPFAGRYARHAVAADHPLASEAGLEILRAGGNAAEAGVATALALGVVSPASSGLGGGGFALYYRAADHSFTFIDFREEAPSAITSTTFARREGDDGATAANRSREGGLAVAVPGEPAGLDALLTLFSSGRVTRTAVAAPAERLAREGFIVSTFVSNASAEVAVALHADPGLHALFPAGATDRIPAGATITRPELADAIATFGREGAAPFYTGDIAREIAAAVAARGGVLTEADLAEYAIRVRDPLTADVLGLHVVTAPPPSAGGATIVTSLAFLDRTLSRDGMPLDDGPALRHALATSFFGAFLDREASLGDPDHVVVPTAELVSLDRVSLRAALFSPWTARPSDDFVLPFAAIAPPTTPGSDAGTSHLCVADSEGNVLALTTTVNLYFGARISAHGIVLNDEMDDFAREVGADNAFALVGGAPNLPGPGRRPVSSMAPTIVTRDGLPVFCAGASGGSRIPTAIVQTLVYTLLLGDDAGAAVERRRIHHQAHPDELVFEHGLDPRIVLGLELRGHHTREIPTGANTQIIRIVRDESGAVVAIEAASDLRKGGEPRGE